ncbi:lysozyme inhibitor LprI family protein [Neobacillus mesonae]|uniref:lysozyme inhibitor LprI family protein n=1 Tax=Neobacillus mesonae TaxID=1193713 RepID=UPI00203D036F|nr:lysozyme inhibitor LprI family protein [Neobacillus mesonae]MCM3571080.1 DUF1311 domain-containing protein [Neobacillus mesonae]
MKNNRNYLITLLTGILVILAACGDISVESNAKPSKNSPIQTANGDSSKKESTEKDKMTKEDSSEDTGSQRFNDQGESSSNSSTNTNDEESLKSSNSDSEITEGKKDKFLKKLNEMDRSDRYAEAKTTKVEIEEQETQRYKKWDAALNEIYGVLKEQLRTEQMDKLREEQRNWVKHRDKAAKEASLKYKGGSMESLEYVASQASLTKERCYELVAKYMN